MKKIDQILTWFQSWNLIDEYSRLFDIDFIVKVGQNQVKIREIFRPAFDVEIWSILRSEIFVNRRWNPVDLFYREDLTSIIWDFFQPRKLTKIQLNFEWISPSIFGRTGSGHFVLIPTRFRNEIYLKSSRIWLMNFASQSVIWLKSHWIFL